MVAEYRSIALGALMLFVLAACSTSSPVRYFSLSSIDSEFQQDPENSVMLGLGPLRMPHYLDRSQIVTRGANTEMQVDEFARWTEPLSKALPRIVATDVDNLLHGVIVVLYPYEAFVRHQVSYRMLGDISRFEADQQGQVVLEVQWGVADSEGNVLVPVRRSRYSAQATVTEDSTRQGAVVAAMNDALAQFSRDIADSVKAVLVN